MNYVIKVDTEGITFDNGVWLSSFHSIDCCESHWLSFKDLTLEDFDNLLFDLSGDEFFERVKDYGIRLIPTNGFPIPIPGYGTNNGYYSEALSLILAKSEDWEEDWNQILKQFDITLCQVVSEY